MIDQQLAGIIMIATLFALLLASTPIGVALGMAGIVGLMMTRGWVSMEFLLGAFPYSYTANIAYIVLPLFLYMGHMTFAAGVSNRAFRAAQSLIGHVPGGLAIATVAASAGFAMVCGSSVAAASTMGRVAIPEMLNRGYSGALSAGSVAAGGTLGVLIPPSGILVVYSIATQTSLLDLFVGALVPGLITAAAYGLLIIGMTLWKPSLAGERVPKAPLRERGLAILQSWEIAALFSIVMGSIYLGIATPTEAAAVGALFATFLVLFRARTDSGNGKPLRLVGRGLVAAGMSTSAIFLLIIGAGLFSLGLSTTQIPVVLSEWLVNLSDNRYVVLALVLVPFLILGMFIDGISIILLTMPIVFPIITKLGFDDVWFGIIVTKTVEIGLLTPPVGLNAFVVKGVAPQLKLGTIFRGCLPFVLLEIPLILLFIAFPELTEFGR